MWCKKRITNLGLLIRLENHKQQFYIESVCGNRTEGDAPLCEHCSKLRVQDKVQYNSTFPHGFVDGPYTKESHIYDSPWYHENVKAYGPAPQAILDIAMEAQRRARAGIRVKTSTECLSPLSTKPNDSPKSEDIAGTTPAPKKRVRKSSSDSDLQSNQVNKKQVKPNPPPSQLSIPEKGLLTIPQCCAYIESTDTSIPIETVQKIKLTKLSLNSQVYWFDKESNIVYARETNGKKGGQVGIIEHGQFLSS
jgi:hypothetical protein